MFSATRPILETITRDPKTDRVRSIKPDEDAVNMWDALDITARSYNWSPDDVSDMNEGFQNSYAYTEADELEDALLFPLEASGEMADNLFRHDPSAMEIFEKETIDVRKFAADLDTDDEPMDSDDDSEFDVEYDSDLAQQAQEALEALSDDDGDEDWEDEDEDEDKGNSDDEDMFGGGGDFITVEEQDAIDKTVDFLSNQMKNFMIREPDYFLSILRNPASAKGIPDLVKRDPTNLMQALRNALRCQKEYDSSHMGIEADFFRHIDRQKSKGKQSRQFVISHLTQDSVQEQLAPG
jgi:hypothetical protein